MNILSADGVRVPGECIFLWGNLLGKCGISRWVEETYGLHHEGITYSGVSPASNDVIVRSRQEHGVGATLLTMHLDREENRVCVNYMGNLSGFPVISEDSKFEVYAPDKRGAPLWQIA